MEYFVIKLKIGYRLNIRNCPKIYTRYFGKPLTSKR